jgi:hypothetical protein
MVFEPLGHSLLMVLDQVTRDTMAARQMQRHRESPHWRDGDRGARGTRVSSLATPWKCTEALWRGPSYPLSSVLPHWSLDNRVSRLLMARPPRSPPSLFFLVISSLSERGRLDPASARDVTAQLLDGFVRPSSLSRVGAWRLRFEW